MVSRRSSHAQIVWVLHKRYLPKLEARLRKRVRDPQRAKDLAQETFARLVARGELGHVRSLRAYLFTIVDNLRKEIARLEKNEREVLTVSSTLASQIADRAAPCLHQMSEAECAVELAQIVERLTGRRKVVFQLSLDGHGNEAIALQLGIPSNTVAQDLFQARREIEEMWNGHGGASHDPQQ